MYALLCILHLVKKNDVLDGMVELLCTIVPQVFEKVDDLQELEPFFRGLNVIQDNFAKFTDQDRLVK